MEKLPRKMISDRKLQKNIQKISITCEDHQPCARSPSTHHKYIQKSQKIHKNKKVEKEVGRKFSSRLIRGKSLERKNSFEKWSTRRTQACSTHTQRLFFKKMREKWRKFFLLSNKKISREPLKRRKKMSWRKISSWCGKRKSFFLWAA